MAISSPQLALLALAVFAPRVEAQVTSGRIIECGSASGSGVKCNTDGPAVRVRVLRNLGGTLCNRPKSWGFTADYIWTDRCKAEFEVTYGPPPAPQARPAPPQAARSPVAAPPDRPSSRITCGSTTGGQSQCKIDGGIAEARVAKELSQGRCRKGTTWGHTESFIWANSGCRAEFEIIRRRVEPARPAHSVVRVLTCGGTENERVECPIGGRVTAVRLIRERSQGRCTEGSRWGFTGSLVWTIGNCRGDFEVTYRGGSPGE